MNNITTSVCNLSNLVNYQSLVEQIKTDVYSDRIEIIYKEWVDLYDLAPVKRVFKVIHSCVDGRWNISERIYGVIIPSQGETYEF